MNITAQLFVLRKKIKALETRELNLMLITFVVAVLGAKEAIFMLTGWNDLAKMEQKINQEVSATTDLLAVLELAKDPEKETKRLQMEALFLQSESELKQINGYLTDMSRILVSPERMSYVLMSMLKQANNIQLENVEKLAAEGISNAEGQILMYRHALRIEITGDYHSLLAWLQQLEQQPDKLYWHKLEIKSGHYPNNSISLEVYTLSEKAEWLEV